MQEIRTVVYDDELRLEACAVKTSVDIYMMPVVTLVTPARILHEKITLLAGIGTAFTLVGLFLSESRERR